MIRICDIKRIGHSRNRLCKKAGIADIFVAMILAFVLMIVIVILVYANTTVTTKMYELAPSLQENFQENVTTILSNTIGNTGAAYESFKWISTLLIFGMFLGVLVSAFLVRTHPAWFIAYFLVLLVGIITSVYVSNTYETLKLNSVLVSTWYQYPTPNLIFQYLPIWMTVFGLVAGALMYINLEWRSAYG